MIFVVAENIVISTFHPLVENWPWCFIRTKQKLLELRSHSKFWGRPETLFLKHSENIDLVAYDYWLLAKYTFYLLLQITSPCSVHSSTPHPTHVHIIDHVMTILFIRKHSVNIIIIVIALSDLLRNHSWSPQKVQRHFVYHFHEKSITFATCHHGSTSEIKN